MNDKMNANNVIFIGHEDEEEEWESEGFDEDGYYERNINKYTGTLLDEDGIDSEGVDGAGHQIYGGDLTEDVMQYDDEDF